MKSQGRGRRINCCSGVQAAHRQQLRPLVIEERPSSAVSNESYSGVASCSCGYGLCCSISSASTQTKPLPSCLQLPICTHLQRIHITLLHKLCCTLLIWLPKFRLCILISLCVCMKWQRNDNELATSTFVYKKALSIFINLHLS